MTSFVEKCDKLPSYQHGFRPNRSVTSLMLETLDDFTKAIDNKSAVDCVYFDIKKPFDTVDTNRPIAKLINLGFTGNIVKWLQDFLTNRKIKIKINGIIFDETSPEFSRGVPQVSLLGPILFNLYIADLSHNLHLFQNITVKAFADDHKAYTIFNVLPNPSPLQEFINYFYNWCNSNGLKISSLKCFILHLGYSNPRRTYTLNSEPIQHVTNHVRDLGFLITLKLDWKAHITPRIRSAFNRWFNLFKFFQTRNHSVCISFTNVMFDQYLNLDHLHLIIVPFISII